MPRAAHHVTVATDDPEAVVAFLVEGMGLEVSYELRASGATTSTLLGWPAFEGEVRGWMVGRGPGSIEVLEIPEALRGAVSPGLSLVSLAVTDLEQSQVAASAAGATTGASIRESNETVEAEATSCVVGGIRFELIQFGSPVATTTDI